MRHLNIISTVIISLFIFGASLPAAAAIVTGWDAQGVPDNLADDYTVTGDMVQAINLAIPEYQDIRESHPDYIASDERSRVTLTAEAEIWVTFLHEGAGFRNTLGCFFYDAAAPPASTAEITHEILFPNASYQGSGGGLESGDTIYLGTHATGTSIGFWLRANAWNGTGVNEHGWSHYSISGLNAETDADLKPHMVLLWQEGDEHLVLSFEDVLRTEAWCDQDFNDAVFLVHTNPPDVVDLTEIVDLPGESDSDGDGVADHADAYPDDSERATVQFTPSVSGYEVLAFEDQWPRKGDYDFNDLVVRYRFREILDAAGDIKEFSGIFEPLARGASYHNGLAVQLPVPELAIESVQLWRDNVAVDVTGCLESGTGDTAVLRIFADAHDELPGTGDSGFANTVAGEGTVSASVIEIRVIFATVVARGDLGSPPFNPFLHRTGSRGHEIHLVDREPSPSAIDGYFGSGDDTSDVGSGAYYRDTSGFPWAMILPSGWNHPHERDQISWGYTRFAEWVTSGGETNPNWFEADLDWDYIWND